MPRRCSHVNGGTLGYDNMTTTISRGRLTHWDETLTFVAKLAASGLLLTIGLGYLIITCHFARLGITDYNFIRPRYVVVGAGFLLFLLAPALVATSGILAFSAIRTRLHASATYLACLAAVGLTMVVLSAILHFFVVTHCTSILFRFWCFYNLKTFLIGHLPFIDLPIAVLTVHGLRMRTVSRTDRRVALGALVFGVTTWIVPFTWIHFLNVTALGGGGQPQLVRIVFAPAATGVTVPASARGDLLLWHHDEQWLYVSRVARPSDIFNIVALRKDQVAAISYESAIIVFSQPDALTPRPPLAEFFTLSHNGS